jgi:sugar lactone lactonase YvrE
LATSAQLRSADDIALDANGNLYIVESSANRVRKVDAATGVLSTVAGTGTDSFSGDGGLATSATLSSTKGICIDNDGNIFISDNNRVRKINAATKTISTVAGTGAYGYSGDGGPATSALLYYPSRLAADQNGNIYFSDNYSHRIRRIDKATGILTTVAGQQQSRGFSGDGGLATAAQLDYPLGVSIDNAGNLYIADTQNSRIRKVDAVTNTITTVAGNGSVSNTPDGVLATAASLMEPEGITVDSEGRLYIADTDNDRVKVVKPRAALITFTKTVEVYNGSARTVSVVTDPPALNVTTTYNGATTAPVDAGDYEVKVMSNDPQFAGSAFTTLTITKASQTINFTLGTKALADGSFDLTATSSASLPVSYSIANPAVATVSGNHVTLVAAGTTTVTASQEGNANYLPAENAHQTLDVVSYTAVSALTGSLDFGDVSITESLQKTITITNSGTGTLDITSIAVPVDFSVDKNTVQIPPGGSTQVTVTFSPLEERGYNGKLTISSNATSGTTEKEITATGVAVTSIDDPPGSARLFEVYPNPTDGILFVRTSDTVGDHILVLQSDGKTAAEVKLSKNAADVLEADISTLPDGLYFIVIQGYKWVRVLKNANLPKH